MRSGQTGRALAVLTIMGLSAAGAQAAITPEEATKDCEAIVALWTENREAVKSIETTYIDFTRPIEEIQPIADAFNKVKNEIVPKIQEQLQPFATKYATPRRGTFTGVPPITIYDTLWDILGKKLDDLNSPQDKFDSMYMAIEKVQEKAKGLAEQAAMEAESTIRLVKEKFYVEDIRVQQLEHTKAVLIMGHSFDGNNEKVNAFLAEIDELMLETAKEIEKDADAKKWAGHIEGFAGPGEVDGLAATALQFFREDRDWGKKEGTEILAVAIRGQWSVAETNILGFVTQWRLPIHLAVTKPGWKEKNLARVYEVSPVGPVGEAGSAPKSPPFEGFWVGDSWMMRITNLPK